MVIFQRPVFTVPILTSSPKLIHIYDAENRANLSFASAEPETLDEENPRVEEFDDSGVAEQKDGEEGSEEYQHEHGDGLAASQGYHRQSYNLDDRR